MTYSAGDVCILMFEGLLVVCAILGWICGQQR